MVQTLQEALEDSEIFRGLQHHPRTFRFTEEVRVVLTVVDRPPHLYVKEQDDGSLSVSGPMANVLHVMASSLNFTYHLIRPVDKIYGSELDNGTWSGQPEIDPWGFLFPLDSVVWAALLASLVITWLAMVVIGSNNNEKGVGCFTWITDLFLEHLRVALRQDFCLEQRHGSERMLVLGWMVVTMMVTWSYSGNLVSLLAVRYIPKPLQTLRDLLDSSVTLIMTRNDIFRNFLLTVKSGDLKGLGNLYKVGRVKYQLSKTFPDVMENLVTKGHHVLFSPGLGLDRLAANYFANTGRCDFYKMRMALFPITHCIIGLKGNLLVRAMSYRVRAILESGLYDHWLMSSIPFSTVCRHAPSIITVREPLAINNLWGMLVLLGAGLLLALVTFCLELYVDKRCSDGAL
ncbi:Glutamate receptor 3.1-like 4 [Homarus americanus]|uniref:Glutamate receptor 3.1-like 4 n=1 Tax=Homarus americanus TaxID=6706 RepID=A0A8J5JEM9_HOMAM|nr:Glutamate receptor 3.1-like 4 [Homarus americanus]